MIDDRTVRRKASQWARDAASQQDLSDAEWECLEDLLRSDEAFGLVVTAQQAAVRVNPDDHDVDDYVTDLAHCSATFAGDAIDRIIEERVADAEAIVELAEEILGEEVPWGVTMDLYRAGFETVADLRAASQGELISVADVHPAVAARIKADVGYPNDVDAQEVEQ